MKRRSAGTILCSSISALLLLVMFATNGRGAEPRSVADAEARAVPTASLQSHEGRLPFVGTSGPALVLTGETQLRLPTRLGAHTGSERCTGPAHVKVVAAHAARAVAAACRFANYTIVLSHARRGIPATHNTPPPVAVS